MAYANKVYVCFDTATDISYYNLMKAWKENGKTQFNFYNAHEGGSEATVKATIIEQLQNAKALLVLIKEKTARLHKYVQWEIEWAIDNDVPIIGVNINKVKCMDNDYCSHLLKDALAIHIPFDKKVIDFALNKWTISHYTNRRKGKTGPFYYEETVYVNLGV